MNQKPDKNFTYLPFKRITIYYLSIFLFMMYIISFWNIKLENKNIW